MNWTLLHDTRVRSPASPVPEPGDVCVGGKVLEEVPPLHHPLPDPEPVDECVGGKVLAEVPPLHHHQPASDRCLQVMRREPPCGTLPLTSASKSSNEFPAASQPASPVLKQLKVVLQPANPEMLVKPVKVVLKRLVELSVPQVLGLAE